MRGGLGRKMVIRVPDDDYAPEGPTSIAVQAGRFKYPPQGMFGAAPGAIALFQVSGQSGDPSGLTLCRSGDVIEFHSAGGGGFGNPLLRDPEAVQSDVRNGYVSIEQARESYGVVIDPQTLALDPAATQKLRSDRE